MKDELVGKYAYKKYGFFSHLIGIIEENYEGISRYKLVTKMGTVIGFNTVNDIVLVDIEDENS